MGKILLVRESNYAGAAANYNIYLDNNKVGKISNGGQIEIDVDNGNHELYLKNALISFGLKSNILSFNTTNTSVVKILVKSVMSKMSGIKLELVSNVNNESKETNEKYDALQKLFDLKEKKIISEEEYEQQKEKIMEGE